jgi:hypothetical protein
MPNLSIKDVPESIAAALRRRAARNHRSLQGELMAIVERAAAESAAASGAGPGAAGVPRDAPSGLSRPAPGAGAATGAGGRQIESIAREHLARRPQPVRGAPRGVDLLRAQRGTR